MVGEQSDRICSYVSKQIFLWDNYKLVIIIVLTV